MLPYSYFDDPEAVKQALRYAVGGSFRHVVQVLDSTDKPTQEELRWDSGWVEWDYRAPDPTVPGGQSAEIAGVRRTASLTIPAGQNVNLNARRLRIYSEVRMPDGSRYKWARFPLGTYIIVNPGAIQDDGVRLVQTLSLADKSHRWGSVGLVNPLHIPAGTNVTTWIADRLASRFGETRHAIPLSASTLLQPRTFETEDSELEVMSQLLQAVGYDQLTVNSVGLPFSQPLSWIRDRGEEHVYGPGDGKVVEAGKVEPLLPTTPNVVRFSARQGPTLGNVDGNGLTYRRNQNSGPASIRARGEEVEITVTVQADSQERLEEIADAECQRYFAGGGIRWEGQVALNPRAGDRDIIGVNLPRLGTGRDPYAVTRWRYPLQVIRSEQAVLMQVTAERRVAL